VVAASRFRVARGAGFVNSHSDIPRRGVHLDRVDVEAVRFQVGHQAGQMRPVTGFAVEIGVETLGRQRREDALVIDFDDVDLVLFEQANDREERARPIL
jgi:hypothetical protein